MNANQNTAKPKIAASAVCRRLDTSWDLAEVEDMFKSYVRLGDQVLGVLVANGITVLTLIEE